MKFEDLKSNYEQLFQKCEINADKIEAANSIVDRIFSNEERYRKAQNKSNVPWSVIGINLVKQLDGVSEGIINNIASGRYEIMVIGKKGERESKANKVIEVQASAMASAEFSLSN